MKSPEVTAAVREESTMTRWTLQAAAMLEASLGRANLAGAMSALLRLASLIAKLGLILYMGRYLSLSDIGVYGLVFGAVMILTTVLGVRFDYVVARDLVRTTPRSAAAMMRDQTVFYLGNYALAALVVVIALGTAGTGIAPRLLCYIFVLTVTDNYANVTFVNMNSMERPLLANALFFISGGLWCFVAIGLGLMFPVYRDVDTILTAWTLGNLGFFAASFWAWRALPWRELRHIRIDWRWVQQGIRTSSLIWLGSLGWAAGSYVDRFIVVHYLGLEKAGIATFYYSLASAMWTLVHTGILSFTYPRLVALQRESDKAGFRREASRAFKFVALAGGIIGTAISCAVPLMGTWFQRPQYAEYETVLWLIVLGVWINANADTLYQVLFARHQDRAVWLGDLLYLIPAVVCSALLVPVLGLAGMGWSTVISASLVFVWRAWHVKSHK